MFSWYVAHVFSKWLWNSPSRPYYYYYYYYYYTFWIKLLRWQFFHRNRDSSLGHHAQSTSSLFWLFEDWSTTSPVATFVSLPSYLGLVLMSVNTSVHLFSTSVTCCLSDFLYFFPWNKGREITFCSSSSYDVCVCFVLVSNSEITGLFSRTLVSPVWYWRTSDSFLLIFWDH